MPLKDHEAYLAYGRAYRLRLGMKPRTPSMRLTNCFGCGTPLGPRGVRYCNGRCQQTTRYRDYIRRWLAGEVSGGTVAGVSDHVKRYLMELSGEKCPVCGWSKRHPTTGRVPLEVDHLNGNYADHSPENVRVLCPNCHALTPTYKALNKGRGRPWTMVRREPK